jgi:uncharacterized protein (DUF362 family)
MNNFIKIRALFSNQDERTVENLAKLYLQDEELRAVVKELIDEELLQNNAVTGKKILLKPNWVRHSLKRDDGICLRTNDALLLVLVALLAEQHPESIMIGDAPLQGCNWAAMVSSAFIDEISRLSREYQVPVMIKDFRRVTFDSTDNLLNKELNPLTDYIIFDLGKDSYLESISSSSEHNFRVTCYDPDRLAESHSKGVHKYCITKELFEADVVISIPKLKTHQKTGITGALKNLVGINGDKDFLPHHRLGGVKNGGDCYPGRHILRYLSEKLLDTANRHIGQSQYFVWRRLSSILWRLSRPKAVHQLAAGWYGNDTCWRMVMDLNRIAICGKRDGSLADKPQRALFSLCDGIIGGQGDGPLNAVPLPLGVVTFSDNSALTDICAGTLMGFDINKIPLLRCAKEQIENIDISISEYHNNGHTLISIPDLKKYSIQTLPPTGWKDFLKN